MVIQLQEACKKGKAAFNAADIPEKMKDWFVGRLDPGFYYSEENDKLFCEWCKGDDIAFSLERKI